MLSLVYRNLLEKNEGKFPTYRVSAAGKEFLKNREKIALAKPKVIEKGPSRKIAGELDFDMALFKQMQALRKELANQRNVPPFVIFSDVSLREMCHYFPQSVESFQKITGVGEMKLEQFGELFMRVIRKYAEENGKAEMDIPSRHKEKKLKEKSAGRGKKRAASGGGVSTIDLTKDLLLQKLTLSEMAEQRGFSAGTIIFHLEQLLESGEEIDIGYLSPSSDRLAKIDAAFEESGGPLLAPVRKILGDDFSYEELRLARIFIKMKD
jgi:ATP-dependent DNA helicase RecQ